MGPAAGRLYPGSLVPRAGFEPADTRFERAASTCWATGVWLGTEEWLQHLNRRRDLNPLSPGWKPGMSPVTPRRHGAGRAGCLGREAPPATVASTDSNPYIDAENVAAWPLAELAFVPEDARPGPCGPVGLFHAIHCGVLNTHSRRPKSGDTARAEGVEPSHVALETAMLTDASRPCGADRATKNRPPLVRASGARVVTFATFAT